MGSLAEPKAGLLIWLKSSQFIGLFTTGGGATRRLSECRLSEQLLDLNQAMSSRRGSHYFDSRLDRQAGSAPDSQTTEARQ